MNAIIKPVVHRYHAAHPTGRAVGGPEPLPPPLPAEVLALRQLYAQSGSKNEVIRRAYGNKNGTILGYVNQALSEGGMA